MKEVNFQEKVIKFFKKQDSLYLFNTNEKFVVGIPDLLISYHGMLICCELKVTKKDKATMHNLFPRYRKQLITLYDIENKGKALTLMMIYFEYYKMVEIIRINFKDYPLDNSDNFNIINNLVLSPVIDIRNDNHFSYHKIFKQKLLATNLKEMLGEI